MEDWYVLYTKPKKEKRVAEELSNIGIKAYCPMIVETRQWSDRKKKVTVPLIPSYVFVQLPEVERSKAFSVQGIVRYMYWLGKPAIVYNREITEIQKWIKNETMDFKLQNLSPGDKYTIKEGHFKNLEGIVNEVNGNRVQIILKGLGLKITMQKKR
ncbi:UpxY family transcription antiterminator [Lutibacter citreus]|uniref:UpxY family transcription antiterminator n=1 Tax=Lutibacter citreus TaxID=2138210 RepID=UPI000DBE7761|nr:UpxY family transcription antiterminator [Lutibacter citreus]